MPNEQWIMASFKLTPSSDTERLVMSLRAVAILGLATIPLNYIVLKRLLATVETVREGTRSLPPTRLVCKRSPGCCSGFKVSVWSSAQSARPFRLRAHLLHLNAGFSTNGWLAVLLMFVLARVFAEGTLMREDLKRTV
jgi:hypothetical protein